jgi:PleD family two-component response regulator
MTREHTRILLVEDDVDHAELLKRVLQTSTYGFSLRIAGSIHEANTVMQVFRPHLIIADALLSDGRGTELAKKPYVKEGKIPVILISSEKNSFIEDEAKRAGISRYIIKSENTFNTIPEITAKILQLRE